jgi:hypothetical protein
MWSRIPELTPHALRKAGPTVCQSPGASLGIRMHDGLPQPPGQFGAQQNKASAVARFMAHARGFAFHSIILGLFVFAAEILFAPEYKPSHLMGAYVGSVEKAEPLNNGGRTATRMEN